MLFFYRNPKELFHPKIVEILGFEPVLTFDPQKSKEVINILVTRKWRKPILDFLSNFYWHFLSISDRFRDNRLQGFQGLTSTFDLQRSPEVKNIFTIWKPIHDFLSNFYWHLLSISYGFRDIRLQSFKGLTLTFDFQRSPEVEKISLFESPYMISYLTSIDIFSLSRTVFEIFDLKCFKVWTWPLTFRGHQRSKIFSSFEIPYMTSYLTSIDTFSLSRTVFEIFNFKVFRVWPWPLTFRGHLEIEKYFHYSKAHTGLPI